MRSSYEDVNLLLANDEEVLYEFKPNKARYIYIGNILGTLLGIAFGSIFFIIGLLGFIGVIIPENGSDPASKWGMFVFMAVGAIPMLSPIIHFFTKFTRYKNHAYIVTNTRLIIRSGFIGLDYKEMSLKSITSMNVRVDFFDKLVNPNTGIIFFASASNPMYSDSQNGKQNISGFRFDYIENPYEVYKKIKEILPE